jgi:pimeloyl-ACP methyl ester carboxylesterase
MTQPWPLAAWPETPTRVLVSRDDRLFPEAFQRRVARERLDVEAETIPGGHLVPLADPEGVADHLIRAAPPRA